MPFTASHLRPFHHRTRPGGGHPGDAWSPRSVRAGLAILLAALLLSGECASQLLLSPPEQVSPSDGATGRPVDVTISWNASLGANRYRLQLSKSTSFSQPAFDMPGLQTTSTTVTGLEESTRYYWRVRCSNDLLVSAWSETWQFTTAGPSLSPPDVPSPISPPDGDVDQPVRPVLAWKSAARAATYSAELSTNLSFDPMIQAVGGIVDTSIQTEELDEDAEYFWRVRAANDAGNSPWSLIRSFRTAPPPVGEPRLLAPPDASAEMGDPVTLRWEATAGASSYGIQIGVTAQFDSMVIDGAQVTTPEYAAAGLEPATTYFWRARARVNNRWGPWAQAWSFSTAPAAPGTLSLEATIPFPDYDDPSRYGPGDYRIVGIPGACGLVAGDLLPGAPGFEWVLYWDRGGTEDFFYRYDGGAEFRFTEGRAFWLVRRGPWSIRQEVPTCPMNAQREAEIPLHPGWNLITNPFTATVPWTNVQSANGISGPLYGFNGGFFESASLEPYTGYYYRNDGGAGVLRIPRGQGSAGGSIPGGMVSGAVESTGEAPGWTVNLDLVSGGLTDRLAAFGVGAGAQDGQDPLDYRRPRAVSGALPSVSFERSGWDSVESSFAHDIRAEIGELSEWAVTISGNPGAPTSLTFRGIGGIPPGYRAFLVDETRRSVVDLGSDTIYSPTGFSGLTRGRIIVGRPGAVAEALRSVGAPKEITLESNYPNPFNPVTWIPLSLPAPAQVELRICDALGREVRALFEGNLAPGRHLFEWNGADDDGRPAAGGIYFARMTTALGAGAVRKLVLLR